MRARVSLQEAFYIYQELADKYNETSLLLNGMAVCKMHMGYFDEAEKYLLKVIRGEQHRGRRRGRLRASRLSAGL